MIILVGSQKGGVGKSTIVPNLAYALRAQHNLNVILVDADPQENLSQWSQSREELENVEPILTVQARGNLTKTLDALNQNHEVVLCDVAGRDSKEMRTGMLVADLFISPITPSQPDVNTLVKLVDVFDEAKGINKGLSGHVFLNRCPVLPNIKEADDANEVLESFPEFNLTKHRVCDRKAFRDTWGEGLTIFEGKTTDSVANGQREITDLLNEILAKVGGINEKFETTSS